MYGNFFVFLFVLLGPRAPSSSTSTSQHRTPYTVHRTPYAVHRTPYTVHHTTPHAVVRCAIQYSPHAHWTDWGLRSDVMTDSGQPPAAFHQAPGRPGPRRPRRCIEHVRKAERGRAEGLFLQAPGRWRRRGQGCGDLGSDFDLDHLSRGSRPPFCLPPPTNITHHTHHTHHTHLTTFSSPHTANHTPHTAHHTPHTTIHNPQSTIHTRAGAVRHVFLVPFPPFPPSIPTLHPPPSHPPSRHGLPGGHVRYASFAHYGFEIGVCNPMLLPDTRFMCTSFCMFL